MSTTLTVDFFCSLDGYGSAEGWPGYWGKEGPELIADRIRTFAQDQVLVFGATTSREFRPHHTGRRHPIGDVVVLVAPGLLLTSARTAWPRVHRSVDTRFHPEVVPHRRVPPEQLGATGARSAGPTERNPS